jgi:hypothetical protein
MEMDVVQLRAGCAFLASQSGADLPFSVDLIVQPADRRRFILDPERHQPFSTLSACSFITWLMLRWTTSEDGAANAFAEKILGFSSVLTPFFGIASFQTSRGKWTPCHAALSQV